MNYINMIKTKLKLKFNKNININILSKIKLPKTIICVTGTMYKKDIIDKILTIANTQNLPIITNKSSDTIENILRTILNNTSLSGKAKNDCLLLSISPKYTKLLFKYLKPNYVLITTLDNENINDNECMNLNTIQTSLNSSKLILNADDPKMISFSKPHILYGLEINKNIYKNKFSPNIKCPMCSKELNYNYYYNESLGDYYCENCNLKRKAPHLKVTKIDFKNNIITINDTYKITLPIFTIPEIYNTLSIFSICSILNLNLDDAAKQISNNNSKLKESEKYTINKRIVYVLNTENTNQNLLFLNENKELKTIIIELNEDKALYEINFESLKNNKIDKIICTGNKNYDLATRIKYSNIDEEKIVVMKNIEEAVRFIKTCTKGNIYAEVNDKDAFNDLMKGK